MLLALDLGTTNVKAVAFGRDGTVLGTAVRPTQTLSPEPGWSEQDPEAIYRLVVDAVRALRVGALAWEPLEALGFSAAMHSLLAVDGAGKPLTRAMLWSDLRADTELEALRRSGEAQELYRRTGTPVHAMSPLAKLLWLRAHRSDVWSAARRFVGIKDYVYFRLTGHWRTDISVGSATGLMNLATMQWGDMALAVTGLTPDRLPALVLTTHTEPAASHDFPELPVGTPVVAGAADGCLANLGSGATAPGTAALTIGTSGALRCCTDEPLLDAAGRTFCYRLDETTFVAGGATNNGANVVEWLRTLLGGQRTTAELLELAGGVEPGADGLLFLPYLFGERAPLWQAGARGLFAGVHALHTPAHFVRAALEGVVYNLFWINQLLEEKQPIAQVFVTGGFTANPFWIQLVADVFGRPVTVTSPTTDSSVLGAAMVVRRALGLPDGVPDNPSRSFEPNAERADAYRAVYGQFRALVERQFG